MRPDETSLDKSFANFMAVRSGLLGTEKDSFYALILRLSMALGEGHSCLTITPHEKKILSATGLALDIGIVACTTPAPLIIDGSHLYLERYYRYESRLATQIQAMASTRFVVDADQAMLELLFVGEPPVGNDQMDAALAALDKALVIVSGGPGTGKTTTVIKMLTLLLASEHRPLRIGLAAPTGKAAMRLSESIGASLERLRVPDALRQRIPESAMTLHRLLGVQKHSPQFRHNHASPLEQDVVVVDEASMVDLAMMSKLVDALKPGSRLILLGDKDQLASVESGAVLGDLIHSMPDNSIELRKTYRFDNNIKRLAANINAADHEAVWQQLVENDSEHVSLCKESDLQGYLSLRYGEYLQFVQGIDSLSEREIRESFLRFNEFQVLCGLAFTDHGVAAINRQLEQSLAARGYHCRYNDWYTGRPILITHNDYGLDLYNGDIGICFWDNLRQGFRVWFERPDGSLKNCAITMLPAFETVYAMTIHKSQGSEFGEVVVVLPKEDNRVLSRELIYTAVTRAKKKVKIVTDRSVLRLALARKHQRHSGLRSMLL
jgi:exodeoxyribonuclease V alpha subunit